MDERQYLSLVGVKELHYGSAEENLEHHMNAAYHQGYSFLGTAGNIVIMQLDPPRVREIENKIAPAIAATEAKS